MSQCHLPELKDNTFGDRFDDFIFPMTISICTTVYENDDLK